LLGHPLALEFLMDDRPIRYLVTGGGAGIGARIKQPGQLVVIQFRWQWPGKPQLIGCREQLLDGADTGFGAGVDLTDRQTGGLSQSKDISDFSHCGPLGWHGLSQKARERTKQIDKTMRWKGFRRNVNTHSGIMNTDSGKSGKAFILNRNGCSRSTRIGVHVEPV